MTGKGEMFYQKSTADCEAYKFLEKILLCQTTVDGKKITGNENPSTIYYKHNLFYENYSPDEFRKYWKLMKNIIRRSDYGTSLHFSALLCRRNIVLTSYIIGARYKKCNSVPLFRVDNGYDRFGAARQPREQKPAFEFRHLYDGYNSK